MALPPDPSSQLQKYCKSLRSQHRVLAFSWSRPEIALNNMALAAHLRAHHNTETFFVTETIAGKLLFLERGFQAFTLNDMVASAGPKPAGALSEETFRSLTDHDRNTQGQNSITPERALQVLHAYTSLLRDTAAHAVCTWNGAVFIQKALAHAAAQAGIPALFMERGLLPQTLTVDPVGVNYGSHIAGGGWHAANAPAPDRQQREKLARYCDTIIRRRQTIVQTGRECGRQEILTRLNIPRKARIALLPLQIEHDSNILYYSPFYKTMTDIITSVQQALAQFDDVHLIVKPHPEDAPRLEALASVCGSRSHLSADINVHSLIDIADIVIVVNSTVGMEALLHQKPLVVLGKAVYAEKGFTHDLRERAGLTAIMQQALAAAGQQAFNTSEWYRFLSYLLKHCLFSLSPQDSWGSRTAIGDMVAGACRKTNSSIELQPARMQNRSHDNFIAMHVLGLLSDAERLQKLSILSYGHDSSRLLNLHEKLQEGDKLDVLPQAGRWPRIAASMLHSYDVALHAGAMTTRQKVLWTLLRATCKLHLR